jgi:hypothetical protein
MLSQGEREPGPLQAESGVSLLRGARLGARHPRYPGQRGLAGEPSRQCAKSSGENGRTDAMW